MKHRRVSIPVPQAYHYTRCKLARREQRHDSK
ncbi:MAG: hypothetical protein ACJAU9_000818 [Lentimonas sp.]|jgi:hypothetical protein